MDLRYTDEQDQFRREVRDWLAGHVPAEPLPSLDTPEGFELHRDWERTLESGNWGMVTWPVEYGGRGCNLIEWLIFEEEYYRAGAPLRVSQNGIFLLGPTLMEFGTDAQKARFLPPMAAGDEIWAQAWSEPNAGSDMAAIRSRATRVTENGEDFYVLEGQKTWSSRAVFADWGFGIFRTEPDSKRHKGLSFILFPLDADGITIRPIRQLDGDAGFAEIFFDDARVPVANRLGDEGQGWHIAMATAGFERGLMLRSPARFQVTARRLIELYRQNAERVSPATGERVIECYLDAEAYCLNTYYTASRLMAGGRIGSEASCNKIFWSELDRRMHRIAMSMLGARAELTEHAADAVDAGRWLDGYLFSLAGPIYAGTNEIQRNIIAERCLGLPRA
ncbi:MAG: acyl-CoA dehydrogenase family protein [Gammaproteobacteria bacterium]|nr:acyl-CoA dehydrogenase family protein [Gammaproteobacteria bacterium]MDH3371921.1 acyl-CoA dehydrogenase family protein [Gammaproteobacteria bacterium]MDH3407750.1 acyl-CoA dehydrogenase family protein [Gammaproteobacteria bacterium]MDH3551131.1 acyl-CoA dehydrogenase family protein [Gammaproteobacteria bacterium]